MIVEIQDLINDLQKLDSYLTNQKNRIEMLEEQNRKNETLKNKIIELLEESKIY